MPRGWATGEMCPKSTEAGLKELPTSQIWEKLSKKKLTAANTLNINIGRECVTEETMTQE